MVLSLRGSDYPTPETLLAFNKELADNSVDACMGLVNELIKRGHSVDFSLGGSNWSPHIVAFSRLTVDGVDCCGIIELEQQKVKYGSFSYIRYSDVNIKAGEYGDRHSYPRKKNGSFSFDKIADKVTYYLKAHDRRLKEQALKQERINQTRTNSERLQALREKHGLKDYDSQLRASCSDTSPALVDVKLVCSLDDADRLLTLIAEISAKKA